MSTSEAASAGLPRTKNLAWVLDAAADLPRYADVCLPPSRPLRADDACLVIDSRELPEDEDIPPEARAAGLTTTLGARQVVAVLENLHMQTAHVEMVDRV